MPVRLAVYDPRQASAEDLDDLEDLLDPKWRASS
jgi:hypothetical protein